MAKRALEGLRSGRACLDARGTRAMLGALHVDMRTKLGGGLGGVSYIGWARGHSVAVKFTKGTDRKYIDEGEIAMKLSSLAARQFPNFPLTVLSSSCTDSATRYTVHPSLKAKVSALGSAYHVMVSELQAYDLREWARNPAHLTNSADSAGALAQIMLAVGKFHDLGYRHNDMHWQNILVRKLPFKGGWWHYRVGQQDVYVENRGYLFILWDFGEASRPGDPANRIRNALHNRPTAVTNNVYHLVRVFADIAKNKHFGFGGMLPKQKPGKEEEKPTARPSNSVHAMAMKIKEVMDGSGLDVDGANLDGGSLLLSVLDVLAKAGGVAGKLPPGSAVLNPGAPFIVTLPTAEWRGRQAFRRASNVGGAAPPGGKQSTVPQGGKQSTVGWPTASQLGSASTGSSSSRSSSGRSSSSRTSSGKPVPASHSGAVPAWAIGARRGLNAFQASGGRSGSAWRDMLRPFQTVFPSAFATGGSNHGNHGNHFGNHGEDPELIIREAQARAQHAHGRRG